MTEVLLIVPSWHSLMKSPGYLSETIQNSNKVFQQCHEMYVNK